ncbi:chemotaxis protein PomA [Treponema primitia ZAS-2]|uniref:Chemotaxis protein PomA n=1 Tax=Treponema primitia (strain ATCC BAA-887 / DSM 12427 / ZAS-2) TaxID=545694 RepID=F5YPT4_TREPZ|nr:motility protein A [Treponema primitia]AEF84615.1 chemotaxis protein PomA [Treponema primitia ZAS-2]
MDISTLIGVAGCFAMVGLGVISGGTSLGTFVDIPSVLIVVLGSYFGLFTFSSIPDAVGIFTTIGLTFRASNYNEKSLIQQLMAMSEKARREGLLALEEMLDDIESDFIKKGLRLVVDGTDAEIVRTLMETEMGQMQERHVSKIQVVNMWGTLAPGLGMLGTVIGLIGMLKNLEDKSALGPNMAVALITTLYGSMVANLLMIPWAGKLKISDAKESKVMEMAIEGVLSIQAGDNPRILGMKLLSYLTPVERKAMEAEILKD